jgi:hypothetical protein
MMDLKYNDVVTIKNEVITSGTLTCKENLQTLYQDFYFSNYYKYDETKAIITTATGDPYLFPLEWLELKERYERQKKVDDALAGKAPDNNSTSKVPEVQNAPSAASVPDPNDVAYDKYKRMTNADAQSNAGITVKGKDGNLRVIPGPAPVLPTGAKKVPSGPVATRPANVPGADLKKSTEPKVRALRPDEKNNPWSMLKKTVNHGDISKTNKERTDFHNPMNPNRNVFTKTPEQQSENIALNQGALARAITSGLVPPGGSGVGNFANIVAGAQGGANLPAVTEKDRTYNVAGETPPAELEPTALDEYKQSPKTRAGVQAMGGLYAGKRLMDTGRGAWMGATMPEHAQADSFRGAPRTMPPHTGLDALVPPDKKLRDSNLLRRVGQTIEGGVRGGLSHALPWGSQTAGVIGGQYDPELSRVARREMDEYKSNKARHAIAPPQNQDSLGNMLDATGKLPKEKALFTSRSGYDAARASQRLQGSKPYLNDRFKRTLLPYGTAFGAGYMHQDMRDKDDTALEQFRKWQPFSMPKMPNIGMPSTPGLPQHPQLPGVN